MRRKNVFINKIFVNLHDPLDAMEEKQKVEFLKNCSEIFNKKEFKDVYDDLVSKQIVFAAREANGDLQLSFARGSINGLDVILNQFKTYDAMYKDILEKNRVEEFDEFSGL